MRALIIAAALLASPAVVADTGTKGHRILTEEAGEIHRTVEVRLERRLAEPELKALARSLSESSARQFRRTLINFYLPGMKVGDGAWATATHTNDVAVRINGLRLDEEQALSAEARADSRSVIGTWLTSTPAAPGRLTILRENGRLIAEWRLRNGITTTDQLVEARQGASRRFDTMPQSAEHFVLSAAGELELRQGDRLIATAEKIAMTPGKPERAPVAAAVPVPTRQTMPAPEAKRAAAIEPARAQRSRAAAIEVINADAGEPMHFSPRAAAAVQAPPAPLPEVVARPAEPAARTAEARSAKAAGAEPIMEEARRKPATTASTQPARPRVRTQVSSASASPPSQSGGGSAQSQLVSRMFRAQYSAY